MSFEKYLTGKKALLITLDDALFPKKDYLLQVYYLFAEFMAYSEQLDSKQVIDFMQAFYNENGEDGIFEQTAAKFNIPEKYDRNFKLLHENARLPLKLLLYQGVLNLLQEVVVDRKQIFVLAEGSPGIAINKIKQTEWHGLQEYLKLYFTAEYGNSMDQTVNALMEDMGLKSDELVLFTSELQSESKLVNSNLECFSVAEIL